MLHAFKTVTSLTRHMDRDNSNSFEGDFKHRTDSSIDVLHHEEKKKGAHTGTCEK